MYEKIDTTLCIATEGQNKYLFSQYLHSILLTHSVWRPCSSGKSERFTDKKYIVKISAKWQNGQSNQLKFICISQILKIPYTKKKARCLTITNKISISINNNWYQPKPTVSVDPHNSYAGLLLNSNYAYHWERYVKINKHLNNKNILGLGISKICGLLLSQRYIIAKSTHTHTHPTVVWPKITNDYS